MILYESERSGDREYIYHQEDENLCFQKHAHYSFEVIFILNGELICEVENEKFNLQKNNALLILPGQVHSYQTKAHSKSYLCVFSIDIVGEFYKHIKGKKLSNPAFQISNTSLPRVLKSNNNIFMKKSVFYYLCSIAYGQSEITPVAQANFHLAALLAFYVQSNYTKNISLKQLSKEYGYSYTYLSSFFNENFKQNFSSYVNQFRLQYAAHLLETTDKDITEIASESGFITIRNFNTAFKNKYNQSPREYRYSKR